MFLYIIDPVIYQAIYLSHYIVHLTTIQTNVSTVLTCGYFFFSSSSTDVILISRYSQASYCNNYILQVKTQSVFRITWYTTVSWQGQLH